MGVSEQRFLPWDWECGGQLWRLIVVATGEVGTDADAAADDDLRDRQRSILRSPTLPLLHTMIFLPHSHLLCGTTRLAHGSWRCAICLPLLLPLLLLLLLLFQSTLGSFAKA
uniref:Uncharacterized protein n=1 Tax=Rhizophora mucronata TaxID=61149 RepID=A0A2P2ISG3_RHIMU